MGYLLLQVAATRYRGKNVVIPQRKKHNKLIMIYHREQMDIL